MQTAKGMIEAGCCFCKAPLTVATACIASLSFALVQDKPRQQGNWCEPFPIVAWLSCFKKYSEETRGSNPR